MTRHRLVRCGVDDMIDTVRRRHPHSRTDAAADGRHPQLVWGERIAGTRLDCRLEIDQGANGVLVHLSAAPVVASGLTAGRVARLTAEVWCSSELAALVRTAEPDGKRALIRVKGLG